MIQLGKQAQPDAVPHPWEMQIQESPDYAPTPIPKDKPVIEIFEEMGCSMLILGSPGSGKTITLLELARDAIARAEEDHELPIPVVFNLSSWAERKPKLADWLMAELNLKYQIPKKVAQEWLEHEELLLLLDGLDEVKSDSREACVKAINAFRQEHGFTTMVVCSRIEEYQKLVTQLNLQGAIRIHPLTLEQIDAYLANFGEELAALYDLIQKDSVLQELAISPMMLSFMIVAYRGISIESLLSYRTVKKRRKQLFAIYVESMLQRRNFYSQYTPHQTIYWLSWIARKMKQNNQSNLFIETLQPTWLPSRQRAIYLFINNLICGIVSMPFCIILVTLYNNFLYGVISGVIYGTLTSLSVMLSPFLKNRIRKSPQKIISSFGFFYAVFFLTNNIIKIKHSMDSNIIITIMLLIWIIPLITIFLFYGMVWKWSISDRGEIRIVEKLTWSWRKALCNIKELSSGAPENDLQKQIWRSVFNFIVAISFSMSISFPFIYESPISFPFSIKLFLSLCILIIDGIFLMLPFTITSHETPNLRVIPNQGVFQSLYNSIQILLIIICLLNLSLIIPMLIGMFTYQDVLSINCIGIGLIGVWFCLRFGAAAYIQHFALRFILSYKGYIPWNFVRFLDYAADRILLRKVGGGYIFIHRLLLEYFAALGSENNEENG